MTAPALYIGTADGLFTLDRRRARSLAGHEVNALLRDEGGWWAIVDGRSIRRREHGGRWREIVALEEPRPLSLLVRDGALYVGTAKACLYRLEGAELVLVPGFGQVEGRSDWYTPWGGPPDTRSLSRTADGAILANVHVGGVVRSEDGERWAPTMDIDADCHQVLGHPSDPSLVFAATAIGLGTSEDGGRTWSFEKRDLHATYQRAVAVAGTTVLVSVSRSERGREATVYRRPLGNGDGFERCREGLPEWFADNVNTGCLVADGEHAALGTVDGLVFRSADAGRSWSSAAEGLPKVKCVAFDA